MARPIARPIRPSNRRSSRTTRRPAGASSCSRSPAGAEWLVAQKIRGVGIDHFSIAGSRDDINPVTHTILLGAGIGIVEELHFPEAAFQLRQPFEFMSLPINLRGHTGAFCRP